MSLEFLAHTAARRLAGHIPDHGCTTHYLAERYCLKHERVISLMNKAQSEGYVLIVEEGDDTVHAKLIFHRSGKR